MALATEILFYVVAALLLYTYAIYPLLLALIPTVRTSNERSLGPEGATSSISGREWPFVSVVVAAHNEEAVIEQKIRNFLSSEYPGGSEIIIVSDASNDRTDEIVGKLASSRVRLLVQERRQGKGVALNRAIPEARGEILVFTDASSMFAPEALTELVRPFDDPAVGLVNGQFYYQGTELGNWYHRYERFLKALEVRHGLIGTAHGAIYAMRKRLWRRHDPRLVNDFLHPVLVSRQRCYATVASKAVCYEDFAMEAQFRRQVRMVALAALVYFVMLPELIRARQWRCLWVLTSHKFLRWMTVVWLAIFAGASLLLASSGGVYRLALEMEGLVGGMAVAGSLASAWGLDERLGFVYRFLTLNCAAALGLWLYVMGRVPSVWKPNSI